MHIKKYILITILALVLMACPAAPMATKVINEAQTIANPPPIPVTGADQFGECGGAVIQPINVAYEQAVVEQTNAIRMQNGLPPLKRVTALDKSARFHAADMAANNYFSHETLANVDGKQQMVCDTWHRIEKYYTNWTALAENIAAGQSTPASAMDGWMHSPEHRRNILSNNYSEIGVGFYEGPGEYRYYWDQDFGTRDNVYPLVIDGEKAVTKSSTVPVYIYGDWKEMRVRSDNGQWSAWQPFSHNLTWKLPRQTGAHVVTAELRSGDKNYTTSNSITYQP